ncbi:LOW QUALITY PROTEIN: protoporphyrinogen oxidase-like [Clytia hemisphaerica]|uniref:LOW QUALITY PROTEIN: protoporphyrinogen oxidase-like n=1 Tax=Clytia hemisphaerica TaxID=252671 RepID=UPI0034D53C6F
MSSWLPIPFRVVILGGGLSGLAAAHTVLKHAQVPTQVTVIESQNRFGGWLESTRFNDGTVFEHGPRSGRSYGNVALDALSLLSDIGIDDKFIGVPKSNDAASRRYIYYNGQILELPRGLALAKKWGPLPKSLLGLMIREPFVKKSDLDDMSVHEFFRRRFNCEEIADYLADPLCHGIFGWNSKQLSLRSCFPMLFDYEKNYGSVVKGALLSKGNKPPISSLSNKAKEQQWMAWSVKGGMQTLPELWSQHLIEKGLQCHLNTECKKLKIEFTTDSRKIHIETNNGTFEADHVISTLSAPVLLDMSKIKHYVTCYKIFGILNMAVMTLQYSGEKIPHSGFGYLVPSKEKLDILGVTFDSHIFPEHALENSSTVTVMAGGPRFHELFGEKADENTATEIAVRSVRDTLNFKSEPIKNVTKMHRNCIPQYHVGHYKTAENIRNYLLEQNLPLSIMGNMWGGPGVNDVIVNARNNTMTWLTNNHLC